MITKKIKRIFVIQSLERILLYGVLSCFFYEQHYFHYMKQVKVFYFVFVGMIILAVLNFDELCLWMQRIL